MYSVFLSSYINTSKTLGELVALHEPSASPSQPRVESQSQFNHETSHFVFLFSISSPTNRLLEIKYIMNIGDFLHLFISAL